MLRRIAPEWVFVCVAFPVGLALLALIPPLGGGNETLNFQRVAGIAAGQVLIGPALVPAGMKDILTETGRVFPEGRRAPYRYSSKDWQRVAAVRLQRERPERIEPNAIAILHPFSYLPQIPVVLAGEAMGARPLTIFYLGRLAGMLTGIALTFLAIKAMPFQKVGLAGIALLPPVLFSRSTFDADQFTVGLAFAFSALVIREIASSGHLRRSCVWLLIITAAVLAQCKSAYLLLPFLCLAIPANRFSAPRHRAAICSAIIAPGLIASILWMLLLRSTYFANAAYRTWSGVVRPSDQMEAVLSDPLAFAGTIARTIFTTQTVPRALLDFLGTFGPPVMIPLLFLPLVAVSLAGVILADAPASAAGRGVRLLTLSIALATLLLILAMLYLQWTRYGGPVIDGFSGRYLYPLAPLLLLSIPRWRGQPASLRAEHWIYGLSATSVSATIWTTWATYWA